MHLRLAIRTQAPAMVIMCAAIKADGRSPLVLFDRGFGINAEYYRENILEGVRILGLLCLEYFGKQG